MNYVPVDQVYVNIFFFLVTNYFVWVLFFYRNKNEKSRYASTCHCVCSKYKWYWWAGDDISSPISPVFNLYSMSSTATSIVCTHTNHFVRNCYVKQHSNKHNEANTRRELENKLIATTAITSHTHTHTAQNKWK